MLRATSKHEEGKMKEEEQVIKNKLSEKEKECEEFGWKNLQLQKEIAELKKVKKGCLGLKKNKTVKVDALMILWTDGTVQAHQDKDIAKNFLKGVIHWASLEKAKLIQCKITYKEK